MVNDSHNWFLPGLLCVILLISSFQITFSLQNLNIKKNQYAKGYCSITTFHKTKLYSTPNPIPPSSQSSSSSEVSKPNKSMEFLKKIGKVGGTANRDLRFAVGVDEGPSGKVLGNDVKVKEIIYFDIFIERFTINI